MSVWVCTCGSEKSHVPPASHAKPFSHFVIASALAGRRTSVIVFRSICLGRPEDQVYRERTKTWQEISSCRGLADPDRHRSRSRDSVIHVYDDAGNLIQTHEHKGE